MNKIILVSEIIVSILLVVSILMQNKGAGLSGTFGGGMGGGYYSKRGFEKFLTRFSVILAMIFIGLAIASLIITG